VPFFDLILTIRLNVHCIYSEPSAPNFFIFHHLPSSSSSIHNNIFPEIFFLPKYKSNESSSQIMNHHHLIYLFHRLQHIQKINHKIKINFTPKWKSIHHPKINLSYPHNLFIFTFIHLLHHSWSYHLLHQFSHFS